MKPLFKIVTLTFLLISIVGCGSGSNSSHTTGDTPQVEKDKNLSSEQSDNKKDELSKLTIGMNTTKTLNPLYNTQSNVEQALYLIFSPLVNIEEDGSISPNLLESWILSENNTALTITLKKGLKWHDGKPLTTDDVIFTLNQIKAIPECAYKQSAENIKAIEKIDDETLKLIYNQSFSGVLQTLFFPVIPKHIYNIENSSDLAIKPIGSGPYKYDSMLPLEAIYLKANPDYFNGKPAIEQIQINLLPDEASSLYSFKQGLIDVVYTDQIEWGKYMNNHSNNSYEMVSPIYEFMGFNFSKSIFQNQNVRKALAYAIDREALVRLYYLDHAIISDTPISPSSYLYDSNMEMTPYDKEKAKLLLTQAGYKLEAQPKDTPSSNNLSFKLMVNEENKNRIKVATEIQKMYADIGVNMVIEKVDKATYLSRLENKQYDAFLGGWKLSYATDLSFAFHSSNSSSGMNYINYRDEKMDELLMKAFTSSTQTLKNNYIALQKYFKEVHPYISLYFRKSVLLTKNTIQGDIQPTPTNVFKTIEKWKIKDRA